MHATAPRTSRGVAASLAASVLFGVLFFLPPLLAPMSGTDVFGWRVLVTVPVVAAVFAATRQWAAVRAVWSRVRERWMLGAVLVLDAVLLGIQLWLFGWAPAAGHGLDAALGYLLLPLVMVVLGVVLHRESLSPLRIAAVVLALVGVVVAVAVAGGVSWVTLLVALGYPLYFVSRRRWLLDTSGALWFELIVLVPVAVVFVATGGGTAAIAATPALLGVLVLLGLVSGVALVLYMAASRQLSFALFGLLTYLEPVLLVAVSVLLLGEALHPADAFVYAPITLALAMLALDSRRRH